MIFLIDGYAAINSVGVSMLIHTFRKPTPPRGESECLEEPQNSSPESKSETRQKTQQWPEVTVEPISRSNNLYECY